MVFKYASYFYRNMIILLKINHIIIHFMRKNILFLVIIIIPFISWNYVSNHSYLVNDGKNNSTSHKEIYKTDHHTESLSDRLWVISDFEKIQNEVYAKRREKLMDYIEGGIAIFASAENLGRRVGAHYEYKQGSDFYYMTGFPEPNAVFLLIPGAEKKFIMFVRQNYPMAKVWTGERFGPEKAGKIFGADKAFPINQLSDLLPKYLKGTKTIYLNPRDKELKEKIISFLEESNIDPMPEFKDPTPFIHEMRLFKDPFEIKQLQKAIDITCESHIEAYKAVKPGMYEYEIEAIIEYIYRKNGAKRPGFSSIVGSGHNSTILHYEENNRKMQEGDMLLMDIGAEYKRYTADVTRTIPVSGKFTKEQKEIYELVLRGQQEAIKLMVPGKGVLEPHLKAVEVIVEGLVNLGLMTDKNSDWQKRFYILYPSSHWLGLDVHDVGDYGWEKGPGWPLFDERGVGRSLEPGMVLTIEPGIYLGEDRMESLFQLFGDKIAEKEIKTFIEKVEPVYSRYINIGVRIEDDILITETGHVVLSAKAPKTVDDIERTMTEKSRFVDK